MSKYDLRTKKGYDFFEVSSALQKCIRRGMEEEAMYWAVELFNSNYQEYIWKRLRIMASEDVGLAVPGIVAEVQALYQHHKLQATKKEDKNQPERLFLTHAVLLLCRSAKSRVVDHALIYHWMRHEHVHLEIPDWALDKHNERGRRLGRGWRHFFFTGTLLADSGSVPGEHEYRQLAMDAVGSPAPSMFATEPQPEQAQTKVLSLFPEPEQPEADAQG
jgi:replication-associated recombination protein RarA